MPIYEYSCRSCGNVFDALVRKEVVPPCPKCASNDLERMISLPAIKSEGTHDLAMRAARKRDRAQGQERVAAQREYEANHDSD